MNETAYQKSIQLQFLEWVLHKVADDAALASMPGVIEELRMQADALRRESLTMKGDSRESI
ncbi:hypothetical protein ACQXX0_02350 [Corynebacterium diphtheriae]